MDTSMISQQSTSSIIGTTRLPALVVFHTEYLVRVARYTPCPVRTTTVVCACRLITYYYYDYKPVLIADSGLESGTPSPPPPA